LASVSSSLQMVQKYHNSFGFSPLPVAQNRSRLKMLCSKKPGPST